MKERWKKVGDFPYEVSTFGRVKRHNGKILKPGKTGRSGRHLTVSLWKYGQGRSFYVHKLVAEAFLGDAPKNAVVHHLDDNGHNNKVDNLCYTTVSWNTKTSKNVGRRPILSSQDVNEIKTLSKSGMLQAELASRFQCNQTVISHVVNEKYTKRTHRCKDQELKLSESEIQKLHKIMEGD